MFSKKASSKIFNNTVVQKSACFLYGSKKVLYSSKYAEYEVIVLNRL